MQHQSVSGRLVPFHKLADQARYKFFTSPLVSSCASLPRQLVLTSRWTSHCSPGWRATALKVGEQSVATTITACLKLFF